MLLRLTKRFTFEMAHALPAYEGKCHNIHGHSYKLFVTVEGTPLQQQGASNDGMVLDFSAIKNIVQQHIVEPFDHAFPKGTRLHSLKLYETESSCAELIL